MSVGILHHSPLGHLHRHHAGVHHRHHSEELFKYFVFFSACALMGLALEIGVMRLLDLVFTTQ